MKETMLVAFASGSIGAVAGAFVAAAMSEGTIVRTVGPSAQESAAAIGGVLEPRFAALQREVAALRAELSAARGTSEPADAPARATPAGDSGGRAADPNGRAEILDAIARLGSRDTQDVAERLFSRGADDLPAPEARIDRVAALHGWDSTSGIRAKWLFLKESAALGWFGTPRDTSYDKDSDTDGWYYDVPVPTSEAPDNTETIRLDFRRGRLVGVSDYSDD